MESTESKSKIIKSIYFHLVSFVALMMITWSTSDLINLALKTWVFTKADAYIYGMPCAKASAIYREPGHEFQVKDMAITEEEMAKCREQEKQNNIVQKQREVVNDISFLAIGIPLFLVHWKIVRRKDEEI